jgi:hypothetical protein
MPRKKQPTAQAAQVAEAPSSQPLVAENPPSTSNGKWAEPYRRIVADPAAGFEVGENKLANLLVFSFAQDPGDPVKDKLKHYGYLYDVRQKNWTVNATPVTREIAQRLAAEFAGEKAVSR